MGFKKKRIAYFLTPITFGGAEKVSLNFLRTIDRKRFDIKLVFLIRPWEEEPYLVREIKHLGYKYETVPVALKADIWDPFRLARVVFRFYIILKNGSFDIAHTHGYFSDICGLPVARLLGIRTLSTCHGFIDNDYKLKVYNRVDTYSLRLCNLIIAVSEGIKESLIHRGVKDSKIVVIPNAVNVQSEKDELLSLRNENRQSLNITPADFVVGYMGRLSKEKGLNFLIEAIAELRNMDVPVKLLIVGVGSEKVTLEKMVINKGLKNMVTFAGFQADIENWLPVFDVFALPSLNEGTPMALLEAMAMGTPVIATAVGGVPKVVIDGINGFLVPPGQISILAEKIQKLKNNPDLKKKIVIAGIKTIKEKHDLESWCRKIENIYEKFNNYSKWDSCEKIYL